MRDWEMIAAIMVAAAIALMPIAAGSWMQSHQLTCDTDSDCAARLGGDGSPDPR